MDNIFIEWLWRSLKYQTVHLHEIGDRFTARRIIGFTARRIIGEWIRFHIAQKAHRALGGQPPTKGYRGSTRVAMMDSPLGPLLTSPPAQQQQQEDRFKLILAAATSTGVHAKFRRQAVRKSASRPPQPICCH